MKRQKPPVRQVSRAAEKVRPAKNGPTPGPQPNEFFQGWFLFLLAIVVYLPALRCGFVWDDDHLITENPLIKAGDGLRRFWFTTEAPDYWPLSNTTWWLEWRLWGMNATGYHATNMILHAASAVCWWRILRLLKIPGAWLAAAIFAVHPINAESVVWIAERKNTLAMFFFALTLLSYLKFDEAGKSKWLWLSVAAFVLALLSKTAIVMLPFVLLSVGWWRRGKIQWRDAWSSLPFFAASFVLGMMTLLVAPLRSHGIDVVRHDDFFTRLAGAGAAVFFYVGKTVLPLNLCFVYPRWQIDGKNILSYVPGLVVAAIPVVCWFRRRTWGRPVLFGFGFFLLMLFPALGFVNIYFMRYSLVADHYEYFSLIGLTALAAAAGVAIGQRLKGNGRFPGLALSAIILLIFGIGTWERTQDYRSAEILWRDTLKKNPEAWLAHSELGNILRQTGRLDEALEHYQMAVKIAPDAMEACDNVGAIFLDQNRPAEALPYFEQAAQIDPRRAEAQYNIATALVQLGRNDEAIPFYEQALRLKPAYFEARNNLANLLLQQEKIPEAIALYQQAIQTKPDYGEAHFNLARALERQGQMDAALTNYQLAAQELPDSPAVHYRLGLALKKQSRISEAVTEWKRTLQLDANHQRARQQLSDLGIAP